MICDNPMCQHHKPMVGHDPRQVMVLGPMQPNGEQPVIKVTRYEYASRFLGPLFYLCGTCHKAVEMTQSPQGHR